MSEPEPETTNDDFVAYPRHTLVGSFHGTDSLQMIIGELTKNGFAPEDMRSFTGEEGIKEMDFDGSGHGSIAELLRSIQHIGPSRTYLERYKTYLEDGDSLLMVHAPKEDQKQIAAEIMKKNSTHRVTYFGTFVIEEL